MGIDGLQIKRQQNRLDIKKPTHKKVVSKELTECRVCKAMISKNASSCPKCGQPMHGPDSSLAITDYSNKIMGGCGAIALALGVFAPLVSFPVVGSINYMSNGDSNTWGIALLILAVITFVSVFIDQIRMLWGTGIISLGIILYTFYGLKKRLGQMNIDLQHDLADNPFKGIAEAAMASVGMQWGWVVLFAGAMLIIAAAAISKE